MIALPTKAAAKTAPVLCAAVLLYILTDLAVFGSGWYRQFLEPESLAGAMEMCLRDEARRPLSPQPQIAVIGNSLLAEGFSPKIADQEAAGRMRFANLSVPGTTPRCWYYALRAADPRANRYQAIVIQTELYADEDGEEPMADQISDLRVIDGLLAPSDAMDFASSFLKPRLRFEALRGVLLKGFVFKYDLQALLASPSKRLQKVALFNGGHATWAYDYEGHKESLAGVTVDWQRHSLRTPAAIPEAIRGRLKRAVFRQPAPHTGLQTIYRRQWFGRIVERYRSSRTHIVFVRVPRGPAVNPCSDPPGAPSTIRQLASDAAVRVLPADTFDALEAPQYFWDELHMNAAGRERFSRMLVQSLARVEGH